MPTPRKGYYNKANEKIPSVTTILSRFKDSGGLIYWAYKRGKDGHAQLYDKAADIGTIAHGMVEHFVNGEDHLLPLETVEKTETSDFSGEPYTVREMQWDGMAIDDEMLDQAENAFNMFKEWLDMSNITLISKWQEKQLISEKQQYGGTPDCIGQKPNGELVLIDWKTSKAIYSDYLVQCAAYIQAWNENCAIGEEITGGAYICRFSKEFPDFSTFYAKDLSMEIEYFNKLLECHKMDKTIGKRV